MAKASLEEVNFEFKFRNVPLEESKSKKQKTSTRDLFPSSELVWTCHKGVEQHSSASQPNPVLPSMTAYPDLDSIESASQPLANTYWEEMLDDPPRLTDDTSANVAGRLVLMDVPRTDYGTDLTMPVNQNQRKRHPPDYGDRKYQSSALTMLKLLEVGIRTAISSSRVQSPPGITLNKKSKGPKLAEIAPVLFSPGYHQVCSPPTESVRKCLTRV